MPPVRIVIRVLMIAAAFAVVAARPVMAQGDAEKGKAVYAAQKCMGCHAIAGAGNKNNPLDGVGSDGRDQAPADDAPTSSAGQDGRRVTPPRPEATTGPPRQTKRPETLGAFFFSPPRGPSETERGAQR